MTRGGDTPPASRAEYALIMLLAVAIGAFALVIAVRGHGDRTRPPRAPTPTIGAADPVIGNRTAGPATRTLSAAQLAAARRAAGRFLGSYLPVLYGRRPASTLIDADAHVRAELAAAGRNPNAPSNRRPRITRLTAQAQSNGSVVVIAVIADGVQPPYQIACELADAGGAWQVSELANY